MATTTAAPTWPTLERVNEAMKLVSEADNAFDDINISLGGLVDHEDPIEHMEGATRPTLEDVGAMAVLCDQLRDEISNLQQWLRDFEKVRNAATYLKALDDA
jgi:hypothetical protein